MASAASARRVHHRRACASTTRGRGPCLASTMTRGVHRGGAAGAAACAPGGWCGGSRTSTPARCGGGRSAPNRSGGRGALMAPGRRPAFDETALTISLHARSSLRFEVVGETARLTDDFPACRRAIILKPFRLEPTPIGLFALLIVAPEIDPEALGVAIVTAYVQSRGRGRFTGAHKAQAWTSAHVVGNDPQGPSFKCRKLAATAPLAGRPLGATSRPGPVYAGPQPATHGKRP